MLELNFSISLSRNPASLSATTAGDGLVSGNDDDGDDAAFRETSPTSRRHDDNARHVICCVG